MTKEFVDAVNELVQKWEEKGRELGRDELEEHVQEFCEVENAVLLLKVVGVLRKRNEKLNAAMEVFPDVAFLFPANFTWEVFALAVPDYWAQLCEDYVLKVLFELVNAEGRWLEAREGECQQSHEQLRIVHKV